MTLSISLSERADVKVLAPFDCPPLREVELKAACGFPSPAADYAKEQFNLADYLLLRPNATFVVAMTGDAMIEAGIFDGDKLFVDTSIDPKDGHIVLAFIDGDLTVRRLRFAEGRPVLAPANGEFSERTPEDLESFSIEGVVVSSARKFV